MPRIGIVAGEPSGDALAAGLLEELRLRRPDLVAEGVGGALLEKAGCRILHPMDPMSVMGLAEVVGSLPKLLRLRRSLAAHFRAQRPDVFIGVDSPDFNLGLERRLRAAGVRTVHYVSPSVWAWRPERIAKIARAVDLMLVLLPFEEEFYKRHGVAVRYVGHPLADRIPLETDRAAARARLGLDSRAPLVAVLPGSRRAELRRHLPHFAGAAQWLHARRAEVQFAGATVNDEAAHYCNESARAMVPAGPAIPFFAGRAHDVLEACDVALLASGTVSLEAMLYNRPMVVAYRMNPLTFAILKRMVRVESVALPNLLAGRRLVPERLQGECTAEVLGADLLHWLDEPAHAAGLGETFRGIHRLLRRGASRAAAESVLELMGTR